MGCQYLAGITARGRSFEYNSVYDAAQPKQVAAPSPVQLLLLVEDDAGFRAKLAIVAKLNAIAHAPR